MAQENNTIVVTAATGNIGSKLVKKLLEAKQRVRAVARNQQKLEPLAKAGAEIFPISVDDSQALTKAFTGAKAVFLLIPPHYAAIDMRGYYSLISKSYIEAIEQSGVKFVMNLSSVGAHLPDKTGPIMGLRDHEQRLNQLDGVNILHLRPSYFMENLLMNVGLIQNAGIMGSPMRADLKGPMIATQDIADYAAERLKKLDFSDVSTQELLGPRDISMDEATKTIGKSIGKPDLKYVQFPYQDAENAMKQMGLSQSAASGMVEMQRSMNEGYLKPEEPRSAKNTTPTTLEQFVTNVFAPVFKQTEKVAAK